jgi:hypothetical protein
MRNSNPPAFERGHKLCVAGNVRMNYANVFQFKMFFPITQSFDSEDLSQDVIATQFAYPIHFPPFARILPWVFKYAKQVLYRSRGAKSGPVKVFST